MLKTTLFLVLGFLLNLISWSQSFTVITSTVPTSLNTCNETQTCTVNIENPSSFLLTGVSSTINLPQGISYVAGTVSGATEFNITDLNAPEFSIADISTLNNQNFSFEIETNCDILSFLNGGGIPSNNVTVNYTANGNNVVQNHTTSSYNITVPNLSVTAFTNQSIAGAIGGNYQRCLTITNGGSGYLTDFTMENTHGNGITVNSVDIGVLTNAGLTETVTLNSANFTTIGDGDGKFETGESIVICEDVTVNNCSDVLSDFDVFWGCGGQQCQVTNTSANVTFGNTTPNLKFVTSRSDLVTCHGMGNTTTHGVTITNIGNGDAVNAIIDIYQGWTNAYHSNTWLSSIDTTSIMVSVNNGAPFHVSPTSITNSINPNGHSCPAVMIGQVLLPFALIQPSDTLVITWDVEECSISSCVDGARFYTKGWHAKGTYDNICNQNFDLDPIRGRSYDYVRHKLASNLSPSNITSGQTKTFNYLISNHELVIRNRDLANDKFWYQLVIPPCLSYAGNLRVLTVNNDTVSLASSFSVSGDTVRVQLNNLGNTTHVINGQLLFDLAANCASCGNVSGNYGIEINSFYNSDTTCVNNNTYNLGCYSSQIYVVCPVNCEGLNFIDFTVQRTNYGHADNDNNGLPDAINIPDFSLVRLDRVMFGDTISMNYKSYIGKIITSPDFQYLTYNSVIVNGNRFTYLDGDITLFDLNTGISHTATGIVPTTNTTAGATRDITFEIDINALAFTPALPGGFLLEDNDTVTFNTSYKNTSNIGGNILACNIKNVLFASDVPSATVPDQYGCNDLEGNFTLIGYYFTNNGTGIYSHKSCDTLSIGKSHYLSIGPGSSNYNGGNLFPHEYRAWRFEDTVTITPPGEYEFVDFKYTLYSTGGNQITHTSKAYELAPQGGTISNEFKFYTGFLFDDSIQTSDDGHRSYSVIRMVPTCNTPKDTSQKINFRHTSEVSFLANTYNYNSYHWLRYDAPRLQVQSLLPSVNVYDSIAQWDISVSNTSNTSDAENFWISIPPISGVTVTELYDVTNGIVITPTANGIYEINVLTASSQLDFKVSANFNSCQKDSVIAHIGWDCQGYPTDLASYPCPTEQITLFTVPKIPSLETIVTALNDSTNLCDTSVYTIKIRNIQTGNAYNTILTGTLPNGAVLVPGTSKAKLPGQGSFITFPDPTNTTGNIWKWDLDTNVIEGIQTTANEMEIQFKFLTTCDYISGSQLNFFSVGEAACPFVSTSATASSTPLIIKDAVQPYVTTIKIITDYISPCKGNTVFGIYLKNNGPLPFNPNDSIFIDLPKDVNFVAGSFTGVYNAPANGVPGINTQNNFEVLTWHLPNGVAVGDSVLFTFEAKANKDSLDCSILNIHAYSTSTSIANCTSSASSCSINTVTGDTNRNVFVYKSYLALNNNNSTSVINGTIGEIGYVNFDIYNTGDTISAGEITYASYYFDRDGNGVLSAADTNFHTSSSTYQIIGNNGTTNFLDTINIPASYACDIIVVLDSSKNGCICSSVQLPISFTVESDLRDTITCSDVPVTYVNDSVNGYLYDWTPTVNFNNYSLAEPTFTKNNVGIIPDTTEYYIAINRSGCFAYDTINIITLPELSVNAGADDSTCNPNYTLNGNIPRTFEEGIWMVSVTNPSVLAFSDSSLNNATISGFIEGVYELYWGHFNNNCDTVLDTVMIYAFDIPTANAGMDDSLCNIYTYTLNGNNPIGTSTGLWTLSGTNPNVITIDFDTAYNANISGLIEGTYELYWTVSNGSCPPDFDTVIIDVFDTPSANAGIDDSLCNIYVYTLNGNQPLGRATGLWTGAISNPNIPVFDFDTAYNANLSGLIEGTYELYWTVSNGNCTPIIDTVVIDVFYTPVANAGLNDSLCNIYTYSLNGNQPAGRATGLWTQNIANTSVATFDFDTAFDANISGLIEGTYEFYWTVSNGNCTPVTDTVIVDVFDAPTANAGIDDSLCNIYTYTLNGNQPLGRATGLWTQNIANTSIAIFDFDTAFNANVSALAEGTYEFYWTVSNGNCAPVIDTIVLDVFDTPVANAGIDDSLCDIYVYTLQGNQPLGRSTGEWTTSLANPSVAIFDDTSLYNANIIGLIEGTYEFYWTVSNGNCVSVVDTLLLYAYDLPVADAGEDDSLCNIYTYTLNGNLPLGTSVGLWTLNAANPTVAAFDFDTLFNANLTNLIEGTYELYWTVSNGICPPVTDTVVLDLFDTPTSNAGMDDSICNIYTYTLDGNQPIGRATGLWTNAISNAFNATFNFDTAYNAVMNGLTEGTYELYWTVSNGSCTPAIDTVIIDVFHKPTSNAGNDTILCQQTTTNLNGNLPIGRATGLWTQSNANPSVAVFGNNTSFNTSISSLVNGIYTFYWTVSNGNCIDAIDSVVINNHPKPVADFTSDLTTICEEECITFDASASTVDPLLRDDIIDYKWTFGDLSSGEDVTRIKCYDDSGDYTVSLIVEATSGCTDTIVKSNYITVNPLPEANFSFSPEAPSIYNVVTFNDESTHSIIIQHFIISDGEENFTQSFPHTFRDTGYFNVKLYVQNFYGCADSIEQNIYIKDRLFLSIPNAFTPNGDGINDIFTPTIQNVVEEEYTLRIYNRWGNLVFETDNPKKGWDGKFNNRLSENNVYVWRIVFREKENPEIQSLTGHVTLAK